MLPKDKILIFEGIDRTGKTALRNAILKLYPGQMTIDRLFLSNYVYRDFYNRNEDLLIYNKLDNILKDVSIIVYTMCGYDTYITRCTENKHVMLSQDDYQKQQNLFHMYLSGCETSFVIIDTSDITIEEEIKQLESLL